MTLSRQQLTRARTRQPRPWRGCGTAPTLVRPIPPTLEAKQALSEGLHEAVAPLPPPVSPLSRPVPLSMEVAVMRMSTLQVRQERTKGSG